MRQLQILQASFLLCSSSALTLTKKSANQLLSRNRRWSKWSKGDQPWEYKEPPFENAYEEHKHSEENDWTTNELRKLYKCTEVYREKYEQYDNQMEILDKNAVRPIYDCKIGGNYINLDVRDEKWAKADPKIFNKVAFTSDDWDYLNYKKWASVKGQEIGNELAWKLVKFNSKSNRSWSWGRSKSQQQNTQVDMDSDLPEDQQMIQACYQAGAEGKFEDAKVASILNQDEFYRFDSIWGDEEGVFVNATLLPTKDLKIDRELRANCYWPAFDRVVDNRRTPWAEKSPTVQGGVYLKWDPNLKGFTNEGKTKSVLCEIRR